MVSRKEVVEAAKTLIGTPWSHIGRAPGVAIDCVGVVVCTLQSLGIAVKDVKNYSRIPDDQGRLLLEHLENQEALERKKEPAEPGDILVFRVGKFKTVPPSHMGIMAKDGRFIHAMNIPTRGRKLFRVKDVIFAGIWESRLHSVWTLKEWQH